MQSVRFAILFPALLAALALGCPKKAGEGEATTPAGETGTTPGRDVEGGDEHDAAALAAEHVLLALTPTIQPEKPVTEADDPRRTLGPSLAGLFGRLPVERLAEAAGNLLTLAAKTRATWACHERSDRLAAYPAQEEFLAGALAVASAVLGEATAPASLKEQARTLVADSLRESPTMQGGVVHRAAADAVFEAASTIDPDDAGRLAPALVEALFIDPLPDPVGDVSQSSPRPEPLRPHVRRALVRLALRGETEREVVVRALLEALAVELLPEQRALPGVDSIEPNEAVALRALPCGETLGRACPEPEAALREFRDRGQAASRAACNRGADPDRPESGFDWGFDPDRVWGTVGDLLTYVLPPSRNGLPPEGSAPTALAVRLLTDQVERAGTWADEVTAAKALHDGIAGLFPDLMAPRRDTAVADRRDAPAPAGAVQQALDALDAARRAEPLVREAVWAAAGTLVERLGASEATPDDVAAAAVPLATVFSDVQSRLLELGDIDHESDAVNGLLWRSSAAARTLGGLGLAGPEDRTVEAVVRLARLASRELMGFRISALRSFPMLVVRWKERFTATGEARLAQPVLPMLLDAIRAFQRPTPDVLDFLLDQLGAPMLLGENSNATIAAGRYLMLNADVAVFRALAARAFLQTFRRAADLPAADRYLERFRFLVRDVLPLTALEKTADSDPAFQLWPSDVLAGYLAPPAEAPPDALSPGEADVALADPVRPAEFAFETYRDALARCVLHEAESRADAARWRRELTDEQKTQYCQKFVEPWASEDPRTSARIELERMQISDERCWTHMKMQHESRFEYCLDVSRRRTPRTDFGLSRAECRRVVGDDDTYLYCVDLRFLPEYLERGRPTLWGCYHRFPWLRGREPIGPDCDHLAQRILAAWLYVKLRDEAEIAAPDGVTMRTVSREPWPTLEQYLGFLQAWAAPSDDGPAMLLAMLPSVVEELSKVRLDFPEFVPPPDAASRTSRTEVARPEEAHAPDFVAQPWWAHEGWTTRVPRDFGGLWTDFQAAWEPPADTPTEPGAPPVRFVRDLAVRLPEGASGPLLDDAAALAVSLVRGDLAGVLDLAAVVDRLAPCAGPAGVNAACAEAALAPSSENDPARRLGNQAAALYLLAAGASTAGDAAARAALEAPICRMATLAAEPDGAIHPSLRPVIEFAFLRTRPACGAAADAADGWNGIWKWILEPPPEPPADTTAEPVSTATMPPAATGHGPGVPAAGGPRRPAAATGSLQPEDVVTFGGLAGGVVGRIVRQHHGRIRHCYEAALRVEPELTGRVTVKWVISAQGTVDSAEVTANATGSDSLAACIVAVVKRITFPQADGVTAVTYPFTLRLAEPDAGSSAAPPPDGEVPAP